MAYSNHTLTSGQPPPSKKPRLMPNPMNSLPPPIQTGSRPGGPPDPAALTKKQKRAARDQFVLQDGLYVRKVMDLVHSIDTSRIAEPEEVPLNLRYFFNLLQRDDPNDPTSERLLNPKCTENIIYLITCLTVNQLNLKIPNRVMSVDHQTNVGVRCDRPGLGFNCHVIRLIGLIKSEELKGILCSLSKIGNGCQANSTSTSGDTHTDNSKYREVLTRGGFEFGYLSNHKIKGYNMQSIGYNNVEDIIQNVECPMTKLNYGYMRMVLTRVKIQLMSLESNLMTRCQTINHFAFTQMQKYLTIYKGINNGISNTMAKLKYGGLATTINIGLIENLIPTYPHIEESHSDNLPSIIVQLNGPTSTIRFPQLHLDVEISTGNVLVVPLGNLLHHYVVPPASPADGRQDQKRLVMVCYTRKCIEEEYERSRKGIK
ncbi:hypothetical protein L486_05792 [Kwoniella mangroviensis CBS 10435]|uniref:Uncharacterized protein n=1 Tax=Kwoniella mangroviensis CBS 10435 TaxID=1331196 RepID=A0A1B9IMV8_9TREE|nr:hypothetical protein L486_05792 [Kwoniella mangroviensis CBS 10435]